MMRRLLFPVDVVSVGAERLYVGGRVCGDLIRLGDCFSSSVPAAELERAIADSHTRRVSLVVRGILVYRQYLNQIDPGMTAELELEPLAVEKPLPGEALVGESSAPAFEEYEVLGFGDLHVKPV
jgi:hypothetical protein